MPDDIEPAQPHFAPERLRELGITVHEYVLLNRYEGLTEALLEAAICTPDQLPGQPGCGLTSTTFPATTTRPKKRVYLKSRISLYVEIACTKEERARRKAKSDAEEEALSARYEAERRRGYAPRPKQFTAEGIRQMAEASFKGVMASLYYTFNLGDETDVPYTFDKNTRDAVNEHVAALYGLFHTGKLTPKLVAVAQADGDFQAFIGRAMRG